MLFSIASCLCPSYLGFLYALLFPFALMPLSLFPSPPSLVRSLSLSFFGLSLSLALSLASFSLPLAPWLPSPATKKDVAPLDLSASEEEEVQSMDVDENSSSEEELVVSSRLAPHKKTKKKAGKRGKPAGKKGGRPAKRAQEASDSEEDAEELSLRRTGTASLGGAPLKRSQDLYGALSCASTPLQFPFVFFLLTSRERESTPLQPPVGPWPSQPASWSRAVPRRGTCTRCCASGRSCTKRTRKRR